MGESGNRQWLALLRGINVGGNNVVRMADLRTHLASAGFADVRTYIQSGNVLWRDDLDSRRAAGERITAALSSLLGKAIDAVVVDRQFMELVVAEAPASFEQDKVTLRCDVMYLKPELDPAEVAAGLPLRDGVDTATAGPGVVYFTRTIDGGSRSYLPKIVGTPIYRQMTIRNWNTTRKLRDMLV